MKLTCGCGCWSIVLVLIYLGIGIIAHFSTPWLIGGALLILGISALIGFGLDVLDALVS